VRAGEIVGMAGLVGAGRTELMESIFGIRPPLAGVVRVGGKTLRLDSPRDAIAAGVALVPEDRKQQGLVLEMSVRQNVSLASLRRQSVRGWLDRAGERRLAADTIERLRVRTPNDQQIVGAKHEIYRIMESLAADGVAVLFVSSDMEEVLGMSDRALVMHEGRITGELSRGELSEEAIMQLATGRERAAAANGKSV
jgi:ribose transport system ATP-binding protein